MRLFSKEMKFISAKKQFILFLTALAVSLFLIDKDATFLFSSLIIVACAVALESAFGYLSSKKFLISESSIIIGLIIGFVLSSDNPWWVNALASVLAICSKHAIRINKKHIFNPATFGIFASIIFFGANTQWKGTFLWYIFIPIGVYFAYRFRKLELVTAYLIAALGLFGLQAVIQETGFAGIFRYLSYFYIFVMIIEPKTTPVKQRAKIIFGLAIAFLILIFVQAGVRFDAELAVLLISNMMVPLLNKIPERGLT